ncbi:MAG: EF-hand domain-containing protein [Pseudomonadota bacterium]
MSQTKKPVALALGAAVATGTLLAGSMFSMQAIAHGYMQDSAKTTAAEGKCGEGKCGEGKCGGDKAKRDAASGMASGKRQHKPHSMASMDTDNDGRMSRAEFNAAHKGSEEKFAGYDVDGDGFITQAEMDAHHAKMKIAKESHGKMGAEGKCGEGKCGSKP